MLPFKILPNAQAALAGVTYLYFRFSFIFFLGITNWKWTEKERVESRRSGKSETKAQNEIELNRWILIAYVFFKCNYLQQRREQVSDDELMIIIVTFFACTRSPRKSSWFRLFLRLGGRACACVAQRLCLSVCYPPYVYFRRWNVLSRNTFCAQRMSQNVNFEKQTKNTRPNWSDAAEMNFWACRVRVRVCEFVD